MLSRNVVRATVPLTKRALAVNTPCVTALLCRSDHHGPLSNYRHPTMDELPIPCGSWQENYDNNQRKYNIHLLLGAGFFVISLISVYSLGNFGDYLLPDNPMPREELMRLRAERKNNV